MPNMTVEMSKSEIAQAIMEWAENHYGMEAKDVRIVTEENPNTQQDEHSITFIVAGYTK